MADPVSVASLGLAVFTTGAQAVTSGAFNSACSPANYMHKKTPSDARWRSIDCIIAVWAWNPRYVFGGDQRFKFRLSYDCNGYDIRHATVVPLITGSSELWTSTFIINWAAKKHSLPQDEVAKIAFNVNGQWNPIGRGNYSFWGRLVISASTGGFVFDKFNIDSEDHMVRAC